MIFDIPAVCLTLTVGAIHIDVAPFGGLPVGRLRLSANLGYVGCWFVCVSWDWRKL